MNTKIEKSNEVVWVGIDVAKARLDVALDRQLFVVANETRSLEKWLAQLLHHPRPVHLVCEATGGYESALTAACHRLSLPISVINPFRVRMAALGSGHLAKTDKIDARFLAEFGRRFAPAPQVKPCPHRQKLASFLSRRLDVVGILTAETNRLQQERDPQIKKFISSSIRRNEAELKKLDRFIAALAQQYPAAARLQQVCGVGQLTAATLLAFMPELGSLSKRQAAALAGVAPLNNQSGQSRGRCSIGAGRPLVRRALYMASLSAIRYNSFLKDFYLRLRANGKPAKLALTAVMRKLIVLLNHLLKYPHFSLAN